MNRFDDMTPEEKRKILKGWLKLDGTRYVMHMLEKCAEDAAKKYDTCTDEELIHLQQLRKTLLVIIPAKIEEIVNISEKWSFSRWLRGLTQSK